MVANTHTSGSVKRKRKHSPSTDERNRRNSASMVAAGSPAADNGDPSASQAEPTTETWLSEPATRQDLPREPSSPTTSEVPRQNSQQDAKLNVAAISFILHPAHEVSTPEKEPQSGLSSEMTESQDEPIIMAGACAVLGVTSSTLHFLSVQCCPCS